MPAEPIFKVYALRYAHRPEATRAENFYRGDPCGTDAMPMDYFTWIAVGRSTTVLIDAGFTRSTAERRKRSYLEDPAVTMTALGVDPASVNQIVITHMHYDHTGHISSFPEARVLIQESEFGFWTSDIAGRGEYPVLSEPGDIAYIKAQHATGRVQLTAGDYEVTPGISIHHVGGHTPGMQIVRVNTARGHVVLASDASHFYENIETDRPFSIVDTLPRMHQAFDRIRELADDDSLIVAGHDPLVRQRFSQVPEVPQATQIA